MINAKAREPNHSAAAANSHKLRRDRGKGGKTKKDEFKRTIDYSRHFGDQDFSANITKANNIPYAEGHYPNNGPPGIDANQKPVSKCHGGE